MKQYKWSSEEIDFLRNNTGKLSDQQIGNHLGRSAIAIDSKRRQLKIPKYNDGQYYKRWSKEEIKILKEHYPKSPRELLLNLLPKRAWDSIKVKAREYKLRRTDTWAKRARFKAKRVYAETEEGLVTIVKTGNEYYTCLNTKEGQKFYHRHLWEKKYGPIPEGYILYCKTDDRTNPDPDNWYLISRAESGKRAVENTNQQKKFDAMKRRGTHASHNLTDAWIASQLAAGDKELKEDILKHQPELIEITRLNMKLKRAIIYEQ